jgi:hypothetical protein
MPLVISDVVTTLLLMLPLWAWCGGIVARRAGYARWWGLAMMIPGINIVILWRFAGADWPHLPTPARPTGPAARM